jgi:hypothetical protein
MSHPHQQGDRESVPQHAATYPRPAFSGARLELPRFQFAPSPGLATTAPAPAPAPERTYSPPPQQRYRPAAPMLAPTIRPVATMAPAPVPTWQATATAVAQPVAVSYTQPMPAAVAPPVRTPAAHAMANVTRPAASVAWQHAAAPAERTLLQRITPVHMGVLMVLVVMMMVVTSGPGAMNAKPARLGAAAAVDGGGGVPMPVRSGATATNAATAAGAQKAGGAAPKVRTIKVGSSQVRARVRAGGIPSPAAAANLAIVGGGRVAASQTGSVRMSGIPSPAASEQLGPQKLPFRPTDGVTLPRASGERDSHAVDTHYGATSLPMEEPAAPAMTPGASAAQAERQVTINQLSGTTSAPAVPTPGGAVLAY